MQSILGKKEVGGKLNLEVGQERPLREESVVLELELGGYLTLDRGLMENSCWERQVDKYD